jgi:hypothetical protein
VFREICGVDLADLVRREGLHPAHERFFPTGGYVHLNVAPQYPSIVVIVVDGHGVAVLLYVAQQLC